VYVQDEISDKQVYFLMMKERLCSEEASLMVKFGARLGNGDFFLFGAFLKVFFWLRRW